MLKRYEVKKYFNFKGKRQKYSERSIPLLDYFKGVGHFDVKIF